MHKEAYQVLSECANGYVGICTSCKEFNFAYKNVLLTFEEDTLLEFFTWLIEGRDNPRHLVELPHGRCNVYQSPMCNLFLIYTREELNEIEQLFMEVQIMLQARSIVTLKNK